MADAAIHTDRDAESEAAADTAGRNRASETAQEYPGGGSAGSRRRRRRASARTSSATAAEA